MKYWLHVTAYTYWLLMLLFGFLAANCFLVLIVGDVGAHGEPPKPLAISTVLYSFGSGVLLLILAGLSFFAGKQQFLSIVIVNFFMVPLLIIMGASIAFYSIFLVTLPPVLLLLSRMYLAKT